MDKEENIGNFLENDSELSFLIEKPMESD